MLRLALTSGVTLLPLFCNSLAANVVPVDFTIEPASSQIEFTIEALGVSDTDDTAVSGTFESRLVIDPSGGDPLVESIEFTGGRLSMTEPLSLTLSTVIIVPVDIDIDVTNMSGFPGTPIPPGPGPVTRSPPDSLHFEFDASYHTLTLDQGLITVTGAFDRQIDLSSDPQVGTIEPGLIGSIGLTETGMNGELTEFDAELFFPVNLIISFDLETGNPLFPTIAVDILALGQVQAFGGFGINLNTGLEADFDDDGDVDGDDFLAWQTGFGTPSGAEKSDGDYDNDGDVDGDDFLGWQAEFGTSSGAASAAMPEPTSLSLALGVAVVGMFARRRSSR